LITIDASFVDLASLPMARDLALDKLFTPIAIEPNAEATAVLPIAIPLPPPALDDRPIDTAS
jgi:hypothetical protein